MPPSKAKKRKIVEEIESEEEPDNSFGGHDNPLLDEPGSMRVEGIYIPPPPKRCAILTTGERLVITQIDNTFFKSYGITQTLGPFHKCFNAVVGPNGSGKSNVIDAMLFVFGYRAAKIRCKKVSVLVHNSENYQNMDSCCVTVHFAVIIDKFGDDYEMVPGSKFTVSRTAFKDNSSYYTINGSRVQFKEVAKLLRKHGIDLDHNRFLILQGEVEQISMMKAKGENEHDVGMLEYLEDIIGTQRYRAPIATLDERLEILCEQRTEKINRVKIIQVEVEQLSKPMKEAVEFLKLENKVTIDKNIVFQWNVYVVQDKMEVVEQDSSSVSSAQQELAANLDSINKGKTMKDTLYKQKIKQHETLIKRRDGVKDAFNIANKKDLQVQEDIAQVNKSRKQKQAELAKEKKKLAGFERTPEQNQETIVECVKKKDEMSVKKHTLSAQRDAIRETFNVQTRELQEQKNTLGARIVALNIDPLKSNLYMAESNLKDYIDAEEQEKQKLNKFQINYDANQQTIMLRTNEIAELRKNIPLSEKSLQSAHDELNSTINEEAEIVNKIRATRMSLAETKSSFQASKSRGRVLDSLMQQKREGNCSGLFGRLGDLGAIDHKYDVAISTACGPLDNIVVDTVATAQWCIEFLKEYDIGRATFIALEKQEHFRQRCESRIQTPENVPRLFDLIRVKDNRIRTAFYYALRDTLVANDLDQASRIAYGAQRYRVVTLAGQLIETSGTMSGGGKTVSRGRMGQSVASTTDPKDVERMENELQKLEDCVQQLRQKQSIFENKINSLSPDLVKMKANLSKYKIELQNAKEEESSILRNLAEQKMIYSSAKVDPKIVKKKTTDVEELKAKYDGVFAKVKQLEAEIKVIDVKIREQTSDKTQNIDKKLQEVNNTINKCEAEIRRLTIGIKTAKRNIQKSTTAVSRFEQEIQEDGTKILSMTKQREEILIDTSKLLKTVESLSEQISDISTECTEIKQEVMALIKQENQVKSDKIEIDQKCKVFEKAINDLKSELHSLRAKLAHLKLEEIPDGPTEQLKTFTKEELQQKDIERLQRDISFNGEQLKAARPNLNAITEYRKKQDIYIQRSNELEEITTSKNKLKRSLDDLRNKRNLEFIDNFKIINSKLKEMYQMITLGGDADLDVLDPFDPFSTGVVFNVRPPKKTWKQISELSGGEKTLSSLALVFALHHYKPSPLYIMDEIDAALDFKNVSIVGNYIKERTRNAQFVIISLRSQMFELGNHLVGIYKTYNTTKSVTINPSIYSDEFIRRQIAKLLSKGCSNKAVENGDIPQPIVNGEPCTLEDEDVNGDADEVADASAMEIE